MPKLLRLSPQAREILGNAAFTIRFRTRSGLRSSISFRDGEAIFHADGDVPADASLFFVSEQQANNLFTQQGMAMPLPYRGFLQPRLFRTFKSLADLLQRYLKPSSEDLKDPEFREIHVQMLMGLVVRSLCQIGEHEPEMRELIQASPRGLAVFQLGGQPDSGWILFEGHTLVSGFGQPPREPDVCVWFKNPTVALEALNDQSDVNALVGLGDIRVSGLIPLADALGVIMRKIPDYLEPEATPANFSTVNIA